MKNLNLRRRSTCRITSCLIRAQEVIGIKFVMLVLIIIIAGSRYFCGILISWLEKFYWHLFWIDPQNKLHSNLKKLLYDKEHN